jgi:hypothetical protein
MSGRARASARLHPGRASFAADTGAVGWTDSLPSSPSGLAIANGVLYACSNAHLRVYAARNGAWLGKGGWCNGLPEIAQGAVYSTYGRLQVATLDGAMYTVARPDPRTLRPTR